MKSVCRSVSLLVLVTIVTNARGETKLEMGNPSFEQGLSAWWTSAPDSMRVDTSRSVSGAHSLRVAPGRRGDLVNSFTPPGPDMLYTVSFSLAGEEGKPLPRGGVWDWRLAPTSVTFVWFDGNDGR